MSLFQRLVDEELSSIRERGYICKSWHEAHGLIMEELEEFWAEVRKKTSKRDRRNALRELVQIAALARRTAEDLALIDDFERELEG